MVDVFAVSALGSNVLLTFFPTEILHIYIYIYIYIGKYVCVCGLIFPTEILHIYIYMYVCVCVCEGRVAQSV